MSRNPPSVLDNTQKNRYEVEPDSDGAGRPRFIARVRVDADAGDRGGYRKITAQSNLNGGNVNVTNLRFESDAMNIDAKGRINLLEEQLDVGVRLKPLGAVSTVAGAVPVVGRVAASLTEIYLNLSGSLDDPRVSIIPGQGIADSIGDQAKGVGSTLKAAAGLVGREENKWIKKEKKPEH